MATERSIACSNNQQKTNPQDYRLGLQNGPGLFLSSVHDGAKQHLSARVMAHEDRGLVRVNDAQLDFRTDWPTL
jgi:hypothetical protein